MIRCASLSFFFCFFLLGFGVLGIDRSWGEEESHQDPQTLTVSEYGTIQLAPDKAVVSLSVETAGESLEDVQADNQERVARVMARLQKLGIKKERIQTSALSVTPQYPPRPRRQSTQSEVPQIPKIIGYKVSNSLTVEVFNLEIVGRVVDSALQAGANRFSHITWALRDDRPARLKALKAAAQGAQVKAETLAQALDVKLIQLLAVNEGRATPIPQRSTRGRAMMSMAIGRWGSSSRLTGRTHDSCFGDPGL